MTLEEAKKVAIIISNAHGGCSDCVRDSCYEAEEQFPEFIWEFDPLSDSSCSVIVKGKEINV